MKKLIAVAGVALMLTGCAGQTDAAGTSAEAPATQTPEPTSEEAFLTEFRATNPDADRATDEQWLNIANSVCDAYEAGASPNQVIDSMQGSSMDADEAASIVVLSAQYLCPEFD